MRRMGNSAQTLYMLTRKLETGKVKETEEPGMAGHRFFSQSIRMDAPEEITA